jgi:hypothetical protein
MQTGPHTEYDVGALRSIGMEVAQVNRRQHNYGTIEWISRWQLLKMSIQTTGMKCLDLLLIKAYWYLIGLNNSWRQRRQHQFKMSKYTQNSIQIKDLLFAIDSTAAKLLIVLEFNSMWLVVCLWCWLITGKPLYFLPTFNYGVNFFIWQDCGFGCLKFPIVKH